MAALDAEKFGTGLDSLRLEVIREGVPVMDSTTTDVSTALGFLNDFAFNFHEYESRSADNMLDVTVRLSVTTDELNAGFKSYFLLANSPLAPCNTPHSRTYDCTRSVGSLKPRGCLCGAY